VAMLITNVGNVIGACAERSRSDIPSFPGNLIIINQKQFPAAWNKFAK